MFYFYFLFFSCFFLYNSSIISSLSLSLLILSFQFLPFFSLHPLNLFISPISYNTHSSLYSVFFFSFHKSLFFSIHLFLFQISISYFEAALFSFVSSYLSFLIGFLILSQQKYFPTAIYPFFVPFFLLALSQKRKKKRILPFLMVFSNQFHSFLIFDII